MLGNFYAQTFFKINFFKKKFRNTIRVSNLLDPGRDLHPVGPDLGPKNCLPTIISRLQKSPLARKELN